jgi:hypothetical protein
MQSDVGRKRIGIIGTRRRNAPSDYKVVEDKFFEIYQKGDWIVSGGCPRGGDYFALMIAKKYGIPILIFYPNWEIGKGAGLVRNTDIANNSDVLIACVAEDRLGGTEDTIRKFHKNCITNNKNEELYLI